MDVQVSERVEEEIPRLIRTVADEVTILGDGGMPIVRRINKLGERLAEERLQLAVLGQFKRGKSTLLNALLGEEILPTSVLPLTAIPTYLNWGDTRKARVIFQDGRSPVDYVADDPAALRKFLAHYVTEQENPENQRGVTRVEVEHPAEILARGVVLIDTPGIGSTFRHNTSTTLSFLPQCDAALFVTAPDPPITEVEADFLENVYTHVARLFVVLNKVDHLAPDEVKEATDFLRRVLEERLGKDVSVHILTTSARQGLIARRKQDSAGWEESGIATLEKHLTDFLVYEKKRTLTAAVVRKVTAEINAAVLQLDLMIRSLSLPLSELESRTAALAAMINEAQEARRTAFDLLAGERRRLSEFIEEQAETLRQEGIKYLEQIMDQVLAQPGVTEDTVRAAVGQAIPQFFASRCDELATRFFQRVEEGLRPHQARADALLNELRARAAELFDVPYHASESKGEFRLVQRPYWVTQTYSTSFLPNPTRLVDRFVPARVRKTRIRSRLANEIETLVLHNVENLRVTTRASLDHTLREFITDLDARFDEVLAATRGAIDAAKHKREESADIAAEITRLEKAKSRLHTLRDEIAKAMK